MPHVSNAPTLASGGRRVWHECGAEVSVWRGKAGVEFLPVYCRQCRRHIWHDALVTGAVVQDRPDRTARFEA